MADSRALRILSSIGFWILVQSAVLAFVIVWLFVVTGDRRRDAALHRGEIIADARSKVNQCVTARPELTKIDAFVKGVLDFHIASYTNALNLLNATPKDDPVYETRKANAARIAKTIPPIRAIHFPVPTVAQCLALGKTRYGIVKPTVPLTPPHRPPTSTNGTETTTP